MRGAHIASRYGTIVRCNNFAPTARPLDLESPVRGHGASHEKRGWTAPSIPTDTLYTARVATVPRDGPPLIRAPAGGAVSGAGQPMHAL